MPTAMNLETIRTIGVANGGGDCPGLNAVIRAVERSVGISFGDEC